MTRVLVTGGSGFIGAPTAAALRARDYDVIAPTHEDVDWLDAAARTRAVREARADTLVHLAWETRHAYFWVAPENLLWRDASIALFDAFLDAGGKRIVAAGSCAEYDWTAAGTTPLSEGASPCNPHMPYGDAKLETLEACEARIAQGASIAWGRIFFLMGKGEDPLRLVPAIVRPLLAGKRVSMSEGTQVRDFIDAEDAGGAFAALAGSSVTGPVNIGTGEGVSLRDLAGYARDVIGQGEIGLGDLPMRPVDPPFLVADTTRLRSEVGFAPAYDWRQAMDRAIAYWRTRATR